MVGAGGGVPPDVALDRAAVLDAIAACRTAAATCDGVATARVRAAAHARIGWEGRTRDAFDLADAVLLDELVHGREQLLILAEELTALVERAAALQARIDRHDSRARDLAEAGT